jgi:arginyl-tRNA--protein-N-Asp/Glu arginylyltransferase
MRFAENANLFKKYNRQRKSQANLSVERVDKVNQFAQVNEATQNYSGTIKNNQETTTSRLRKKLL